MKWTHLIWVAVAAMLLTAPMALAADKGGDKAKGSAVYGELTKVGKVENSDTVNSIDISVKGKDKAAPAETKTIAVDANTKILVAKAPPEGSTEKPKPEEGKASDLEVGKKVAVKCTEDGKTALSIMILPAGGHKHGEKKPA